MNGLKFADNGHHSKNISYRGRIPHPQTKGGEEKSYYYSYIASRRLCSCFKVEPRRSTKDQGQNSYAYLHKRSAGSRRRSTRPLATGGAEGPRSLQLVGQRPTAWPARQEQAGHVLVGVSNPTDMSAWIATRDRIAASPSAAGPPAEDLGEEVEDPAKAGAASTSPNCERRVFHGAAASCEVPKSSVRRRCYSSRYSQSRPPPATPATEPAASPGSTRADSPPPTASIVLCISVPTTVAADRFVAMGREGDPAFDTCAHGASCWAAAIHRDGRFRAHRLITSCRGAERRVQDLKRSHYYSTDPTPPGPEPELATAAEGGRRIPGPERAEYSGQLNRFSTSAVRKAGRHRVRSALRTPEGWTEVEMLGCLISPS